MIHVLYIRGYQINQNDFDIKQIFQSEKSAKLSITGHLRLEFTNHQGLEGPS